MNSAFGAGKSAKFFLRGVSIALVVVALWMALCVRVSGVDQPYLMIIAQEVLFGHHRGMWEFPSSVYLHAPPIIGLHWLGWPVVFSWNLYIAVACAFSAYVFAFRMNTRMPGVVMCLWLAATLLLFDDTNVGQREFFFAVFWFPYLIARMHEPTRKFAIVDILCGIALSITICVKFYFVLFVLVIDIPLLLLCRIRQSYAAFCAMTAGGLVQAGILFRNYSIDRDVVVERFHSYYGTIGLDHLAVVKYLLISPSVCISIATIAVILLVTFAMHRRAVFAVACAASAVVCLFLAIMQGGPRSYNLIPLFLAAVACSLEASFSRIAAIEKGDELVGAFARCRTIIVAICAVVAIGAVLFSDTGLGRAVLMKYVWNRPDYARIGRVPEDEYMSWVKKHVAANEDIDVIALQYGGTSAFDPVLSTIRLGRRVNSANPILQFPLRAALVSGDRGRIDAAWDALIEEISAGAPAWVIIRRTTPAPMAPDFVKIIEAEPRFYSWLTSHYALYEEFGPYVAYRRSE